MWLSSDAEDVSICSVTRVVRARSERKLHCLRFVLTEGGTYVAMNLTACGAVVEVHTNHVLISGFTLDHLGRLAPGISEIIKEIVYDHMI